jgi:hypothetical protein
MNKSKIVFLSVAVAAGVGLSSCGAPGQAGEAGQGTAAASSAAASQTDASSSAAATSSPTQAAASTVSPSAAATPSVAKPTATPSPDGSAGLASFTFPDGHLSFSYPTNWTIRVEKTAPSANQPPGIDPVLAVLADETGNELLAITSNADGGGASGPVLRTVLDNAPVPGLKDTSGEQLDFGFAFDSFADHPEFHMGIRKSRDFEPSPESSGSTRVALANGFLDTHVFFGTPAFPSIDAAKAWMATNQYGDLKQLLLSVRYQ